MMKTIILAFALWSGLANAAICGMNLLCGTYSAEDTYGGKIVTRQHIFSEPQPNQVVMEVKSIDNGVVSSRELIMKFEADGRFTVYNPKAEAVGAGFCMEKMCSLSTPAYMFDGVVGIQALILRFSADSMQFVKLFANANGEHHHSSVDFKKLP